ncbi:MAG: hypothetical protein U0169_08080 [Polyangiaceae bacterium]
MKRQPRLTKREKKALSPAKARPQAQGGGHIHCIACGRHIEPIEFEAQATATVLTCQHGSNFPSCVACTMTSQRLLDEHDRSGQPVKTASAWH